MNLAQDVSRQFLVKAMKVQRSPNLPDLATTVTNMNPRSRGIGARPQPRRARNAQEKPEQEVSTAISMEDSANSLWCN